MQDGLRNLWQILGRPIAAYCAAAIVAACVLLVADPWFRGPSWGFSLAATLLLGLVVAIIAGFPTLIVAGLLFMTRIPRGIGESAAGAAIGAICYVLIFGIGKNMLLWALSYIAAGALAGLVYWLLVGRPQNPNILNE